MADKNKEIIISYLEQARENWLTTRDSAERAGHMSVALNNLEDESMRIVDGLLEELHALGGLAVRSAE